MSSVVPRHPAAYGVPTRTNVLFRNIDLRRQATSSIDFGFATRQRNGSALVVNRLLVMLDCSTPASDVRNVYDAQPSLAKSQDIYCCYQPTTSPCESATSIRPAMMPPRTTVFAQHNSVDRRKRAASCTSHRCCLSVDRSRLQSAAQETSKKPSPSPCGFRHQ